MSITFVFALKNNYIKEEKKYYYKRCDTFKD